MCSRLSGAPLAVWMGLGAEGDHSWQGLCECGGAGCVGRAGAEPVGGPAGGTGPEPQGTDTHREAGLHELRALPSVRGQSRRPFPAAVMNCPLTVVPLTDPTGVGGQGSWRCSPDSGGRTERGARRRRTGKRKMPCCATLSPRTSLWPGRGGRASALLLEGGGNSNPRGSSGSWEGRRHSPHTRQAHAGPRGSEPGVASSSRLGHG